jgi:methionyl-tRNA formyltransferase
MTDPRTLRVLFLGTPEFAVPSLRALAESRHRVVGVISQPDRPRGRGRKLEPTPVHREAEARSLPVLQPEKVGLSEAVGWMRERAPDLGCVVAFGQFIPRKVREIPPNGMINAHASLLPRFRGAAPIQHAILEGDAESGVTIIRIEREMDAGDWCVMRRTPIDPDETAGELSPRLADLAAEALLEAVEQIARGAARFRPQATEGVSLAPRVTREFGRVRFDETVERVLRRLRAATPWPGVDLELAPSGRRLRLLAARRYSGERPPAAPGALRAEEGLLLVSALDGWIEVQRLQVPGRRPVDAAEFLRGARIGARGEAKSVWETSKPPSS